MNILFLSLIDIQSINDSNIYTDLLKEFINNGDNVYIVSPTERRNKRKTHLIKDKKCEILKVKIGNITKVNIIEKGISTLLIETTFKKQIKKYYKNIKFDLILYATPPITFCNVIKYIKKRDNAKSYLMLKDIFPQNAVDLNMFSKRSIFYKYFRKKEIELYKISDYIGCMSPKNKEYLIEHNKYLNKDKIGILPNSISLKKENEYNEKLKIEYRKKYKIPQDSKVFVYGGNLGKPQGVTFIIECLKKISKLKNCYFIICGTGTEYQKLSLHCEQNKYKNIILINGLPSEEYNKFLNIGDIGLIFLDYNFTIPNFPSRILSYMEKSMPILACTDRNTDIGDIIEENIFGWKCYSNDVEKFYNLVKNTISLETKTIIKMGKNGRKYLEKNYNTKEIIKLIIEEDDK